MFLQRSAVRATQRGAPRILYPRVPLGLQRRSIASEGKLRNLPDNSFNREREAVKAHAAATSGLLILLLGQFETKFLTNAL